MHGWKRHGAEPEQAPVLHCIHTAIAYPPTHPPTHLAPCGDLRPLVLLLLAFPCGGGGLQLLAVPRLRLDRALLRQVRHDALAGALLLPGTLVPHLQRCRQGDMHSFPIRMDWQERDSLPQPRKLRCRAAAAARRRRRGRRWAPRSAFHSYSGAHRVYRLAALARLASSAHGKSFSQPRPRNGRRWS